MKYLEIDVSDVVDLAHGLAKNLSHDKAVTMMRRTFWEAGQHVPKVLRDVVPQDYEVTKGWVSKHVGAPHMGGSLGEVSVVVPLKGARGSIGGTFPASGGYHRQTRGTQVHMKDGTVRNRKAYWRDARVKATILKGQSSQLPATMDHQGGNPPFMAGGVGFTRTTKKRLPIAHVVGLSLPQMPLNQSEKKARKEIEEYTMKRLIHNFEFLLSR